MLIFLWTLEFSHDCSFFFSFCKSFHPNCGIEDFENEIPGRLFNLQNHCHLPGVRFNFWFQRRFDIKVVTFQYLFAFSPSLSLLE